MEKQPYSFTSTEPEKNTACFPDLAVVVMILNSASTSFLCCGCIGVGNPLSWVTPASLISLYHASSRPFLGLLNVGSSCCFWVESPSGLSNGALFFSLLCFCWRSVPQPGLTPRNSFPAFYLVELRRGVCTTFQIPPHKLALASLGGEYVSALFELLPLLGNIS